MNLLEMNDIILYGNKKKTTIPGITVDDLILFQDTINMSKIMKAMFEKTDDANSFFSIYPNVKKIVGAKKCVECFYACKVGYIMHGIPSKLVYVLTKVSEMAEHECANLALSKAIPLIKSYANCLFTVDGAEYTVKDVMDNVWGRNVKLLNDSIRKVQVGTDSWEVFIPGVDRVALLPTDIASVLSNEDCEKLAFTTGKGIVLGDIILRSYGRRLGITTDDFDLRKAV